MKTHIESPVAPLNKRRAHILVKDESVQPTGTWKDRSTGVLLDAALQSRAEVLALFSYGNAAASVLYHAQRTHLLLLACIGNATGLLNDHYNRALPTVLRVIASDTSIVLEAKRNRYMNDQELARTALFLHARKKPSSVYLPSYCKENGYHSLYQEIMQVEPDYIILPVGGGDAFLSLASLIRDNAASVRLIGMRPTHESFYQSDKLFSKFQPTDASFRNELAEGHQIWGVSPWEQIEAYRAFRKKYAMEPSSAVAFAHHDRVQLLEGTVVIINSGRGLPHQQYFQEKPEQPFKIVPLYSGYFHGGRLCSGYVLARYRKKNGEFPKFV